MKHAEQIVPVGNHIALTAAPWLITKPCKHVIECLDNNIISGLGRCRVRSVLKPVVVIDDRAARQAMEEDIEQAVHTHCIYERGSQLICKGERDRLTDPGILEHPCIGAVSPLCPFGRPSFDKMAVPCR